MTAFLVQIASLCLCAYGSYMAGRSGRNLVWLRWMNRLLDAGNYPLEQFKKTPPPGFEKFYASLDSDQ